MEVFLTPGGHRRFQRRSLLRLFRTSTPERSALGGLGATPQRMTDAYRRTHLAHGTREPDPLRAVAEEDRVTFRETAWRPRAAA